VNLRGVNYDVGRVLQGHLMRPIFDANIVHRELEIIKNDLHCNAVKIQGFDIGRLMVAAEDALTQGLEVWLAPEMFEKSPDETFEYTVKAAEATEILRQRWPEKLVISIGTELMLFMRGILEGDSLMERISNPMIWQKIKSGVYNKPLNEYLARTNQSVRKVFHGRVTYASVARIETIDWSLFDYVCIDCYRDKQVKNSFGEVVRQYFAYGKPVVVGEFGCCTFKGAEDLGGMGWNIVNWSKMPPELKASYVYDQGVQAREIVDELQIFDDVGVDGAFVFTFVQPSVDNNDPSFLKMLENLKFDPDIASYSLAKSYAGDKRGATYPDMPWEPKESFRAVADYYSK